MSVCIRTAHSGEGWSCSCGEEESLVLSEDEEYAAAVRELDEFVQTLALSEDTTGEEDSMEGGAFGSETVVPVIRTNTKVVYAEDEKPQAQRDAEHEVRQAWFAGRISAAEGEKRLAKIAEEYE